MTDGAPLRVAVISVHTSPLHQPGTGDAGGLNVYVLEQARALAAAGHTVDIYTRKTSVAEADTVDVSERVRVHHVTAGPVGPVAKEDLPELLTAFTEELLAVALPPDIVHGHYWLSAVVAAEAAKAWDVAVVNTMHTLARVKNANLAPGDRAEPQGRIIGETDALQRADAVLANTDTEVHDLVTRYQVPCDRVHRVPPGVDTSLFRPLAAAQRAQVRAGLGVTDEQHLVLFVGRVQALKGPHVLVRAAASLVRQDAAWASRLRVLINGGSSGSGPVTVESLRADALAAGLWSDAEQDTVIRFCPPVPRRHLAQMYAAADLVAMPSHHETFGLVAIEAQAAGTPVVAAHVGGLVSAVSDGVSGVLVDGHDPDDWADALAALLDDPDRRAKLAERAVEHAAEFRWTEFARRTVDVYRWAMRRQGENHE